MRQRELITLVRDWINANTPDTWRETTLVAEASYTHVHFRENEPDQAAIIVMPSKIEWVRKDRGNRARRQHLIDIIAFGGPKEVEFLENIMDGFEQLAEDLMMSPLDGADTLAAETLAADPAGYDKESLTDTVLPFLAGIRLTFWVG